MDNFYSNTNNDYTIQNPEGKFYAMVNGDTTFIGNPYKSMSLFKEDAEELVRSFNKDPNIPKFKGCIAIEREEAIKEYNKQKLVKGNLE